MVKYMFGDLQEPLTTIWQMAMANGEAIAICHIQAIWLSHQPLASDTSYGNVIGGMSATM
jgi:hypothetical protein